MNSTKYRMIRGTMVGHDEYYHPPSEPHQELAAAIVRQAVKDYISILRKLWRGCGSVEDKRAWIAVKLEIESFFRSQWYAALTDIDHVRITRECVRKAREIEKRSIARKNAKDVRAMFMEAGD